MQSGFCRPNARTYRPVVVGRWISFESRSANVGRGCPRLTTLVTGAEEARGTGTERSYMKTTSKKWTKLFVVGAAAISMMLVGLTPAVAQTPSPPDFGLCQEPNGGPVFDELGELPAVEGRDGDVRWLAFRGSYGTDPYGPYGYSDKIVYDQVNDQYVHARFRSNTGAWSRVSCKPKEEDETEADVPSFGGGGGGGIGPTEITVTYGLSFWTFFSTGGVRTGTVTVGEPTPYETSIQ